MKLEVLIRRAVSNQTCANNDRFTIIYYWKQFMRDVSAVLTISMSEIIGSGQ